ncbi:hypothetical protein GWI33_020544 [Rhynchophorus ferrugineus]|uniref:Uncharacterized protein n=1 Tax=Rhynchophorus ferrugineus TaxID=354439 RepID=A0A834HS63_RHYFE|nr:hypothetical protein GWI33_020544 [Rhynchophorus ferrugineus]
MYFNYLAIRWVTSELRIGDRVMCTNMFHSELTTNHLSSRAKREGDRVMCTDMFHSELTTNYLSSREQREKVPHCFAFCLEPTHLPLQKNDDPEGHRISGARVFTVTLPVVIL